MTHTYCKLEISNSRQFIPQINTILKVISTDENTWNVEVELKENIGYNDVLSDFADLIINNQDELLKLGIPSTSISLWLIYSYHDQCNLEFTPKLMNKIGSYGYNLCVSCYLIGSEIELFDDLLN